MITAAAEERAKSLCVGVAGREWWPSLEWTKARRGEARRDKAAFLALSPSFHVQKRRCVKSPVKLNRVSSDVLILIASCLFRFSLCRLLVRPSVIPSVCSLFPKRRRIVYSESRLSYIIFPRQVIRKIETEKRLQFDVLKHLIWRLFFLSSLVNKQTFQNSSSSDFTCWSSDKRASFPPPPHLLFICLRTDSYVAKKTINENPTH